MDVRKTIAELTSQLSEINYDSDEDNVLLKGTNYNDEGINSPVEEDNFNELEPSILRKSTDKLKLPESIYGGKKTTRKKTYSSPDSDEELIGNELNNRSSDQDSDEQVSDEEISDENDSPEDEELSETEDLSAVSSKTETTNNNKDNLTNYNIYSTESKNIANDIKKGVAIRNQYRIWENLLEGKIKLQQALEACNNLPPGKSLTKSTLELDAENQLKINRIKKNGIILLDKLLDLHEELKKQCSEFVSNKEGEQNEIPSDESEIEDENEQNQEEDYQCPRKKRKLNEYSSLIQNVHSKFIPYRNACIQKWNDKTKVSSGKMANSNFSAFDQSTLKQIEQIMADKSRLIDRTRKRRSENQEPHLDPEVFDDTDFYHQLLRDYIERKSSDVDNSHTERQLIDLYKLRKKMKKNVDTRSSKGRKIRFVVLPKLVNFMAPNPYNAWSGEAETELFSSLFGKIKC